MDREAIESIIPHRGNMLLVDEAELMEDGTAVGKYTVRGDEFFLQGHFPGNPVVPGVMLCEMMAQSACLLIEDGDHSLTPYFTGMKNVKFKNKVLPGDTVVFRSEKTAHRHPFYFMKSTGYVGEKMCVCGELSFAIEQKG